MRLSINLEQLSPVILLGLAKQITDPETLDQLLKFDEQSLCAEIAGNECTSQDTLRYLYHNYREKVLGRLARNKSTPQEIIHDIAINVSNACEAGEVLENPSISSEDIDMLLKKHRCGHVINQVIRNPNTTAETLIKAAGDDKEYIHRVLCTGKVKLAKTES